MTNIRNLDLRSYAVIGLLVLWASLTFSIALTEISFVCALAFWVLWRFRLQKGPDIFFSREEKVPASFRIDWAFWAPLALFFVFVLASYFTSEYPKQSLRGLFKIAKPLVVFIMAGDLFRGERPREWFGHVFLMTFLLVVVDCSIQGAFGKDLLRGFAAERSGAGMRLVGPFGNFAKMATYLILVISIYAMRFWGEFSRPSSRRQAFYSLILVFAGLLLLYLTRCRGALLALVLSFSCVFIYKRWFKILGLGLVCFAVFLFSVAPEKIIHQDITGKEQSFHERLCLWRRAMDVIVAKPLLGTGINTYDKAHAKYDTLKQKKYMPISGISKIRQNQDGSVSFDNIWTSDKDQKTIRMAGIDYNIHRDRDGRYFVWNDYISRGYYAHNGYLQLAAEIGIPGIFCFLWFLFMFFRRAVQSIRRVRGLPDEYIQLGYLTGLLAFLIYAAADNNLQSPPSLMMFWFLAGVLMARQISFSASSDARSGDEGF